MSSSTTNNSERQAAIRQYNELIQEQQQLAQKITELESDRNEHSLVADTLEPLEPGRRAYRLVGEVLVERTVEEVLPSIKKNMENIEAAIAGLRDKLLKSMGESTDIKTKYNLQPEQA